MNINFMRFVDKYIGKLIILILSILRNYNNVREETKFHNFIISKFFGMGTIILSIPLLKAIKVKYNNSKIIFLTFKENSEIFEFFNLVDEVILIRRNNLFNFFIDTVKTLFYLRTKIKPDVFIDLEFFSNYSTIISFMSRAIIRIGFGLNDQIREKLLTNKVKFDGRLHILELFKALGNIISVNEEFSMIPPVVKEKHSKSIDIWLDNIGLKEKSFIIISTRSSTDLGCLKEWSIFKWAKLIERILKETKIKIVLTGLKEDFIYIEKIIFNVRNKQKSNLYNASGCFNLGEFISLLKKSKFLITLDSGPFHLAQSLKIPCVVLFGPETPLLYGPRDGINFIVYKNLPCSPCVNVLDGKKMKCKNEIFNKCMKDIEVEEVFQNVIELNKFLDQKYNIQFLNYSS